MFWKRKLNSPGMFTLETNNRRSSFRVRPTEEAPILISFCGKETRVIDVGAGGLAIEDMGFVKGDSQLINFKVPGKDTTISVILELIEILPQNICHCRFIDIQEEDIEAIHQYMLARQKEDIKANKDQKKQKVFSGIPTS